MVDNVAITPGTGATVAADDIGGVLHQRVKLALGADGTGVDAVAGAGVVGTGVQRITIATDDQTASNLNNALVGDYETVAASATDQVLGATGAAGDYLSGLLIVPATTAAGAVSIKDDSGSAITIFAGGGTTALTTLIPFFVPLGMKSTAGAWKVTTGANVSVIGIGNFT